MLFLEEGERNEGQKNRKQCLKGPLFIPQAITMVNLDGGRNQPKAGGDLPARNLLGHPRALPNPEKVLCKSPCKCCFVMNTPGLPCRAENI